MKTLLSILLLAVAVLPVRAAEPALYLSERGQSLLNDDLNQLDTKGWHVAKGKWEIVEGSLRGAEIAEDKHPGVVRHQIPFTNAIIQVEVKLDGAKQSALSINDAKEHVARVLLTPASFTAQKDDHDHDGPDKAQVFGRREVKFAPGEWHTISVEFVGDTMVATLDGQNLIAGSNELIGTAKANFGFTVAGETVSYRNLRIWEATPKADWEKTKAKLVAESAAKLPKPAAK